MGPPPAMLPPHHSPVVTPPPPPTPTPLPPPPPTISLPTPTPAPPTDGPDSCTIATLQAGFSAIESFCCVHEDCESGPPTTCSAQCGNLVLDFRDRCQSILDSIPGGFSNLEEFAAVCEQAEHHSDGSSASSTGGDHKVGQLIGSLSTGQSVTQYSCSYTEVMSVALVCTQISAQTVLSPDFCTSDCATKMVPFARQCAGVMGASLAAFDLSNMVDTVVQKCGGGSAKGDATATGGSGPEAAAAAVSAECASISMSMTEQLSEVCCEDPMCAKMPSSCTHRCRAILLPYFHDCASEMATSSPELFTRITGLASICTNEQSAGGSH